MFKHSTAASETGGETPTTFYFAGDRLLVTMNGDSAELLNLPMGSGRFPTSVSLLGIGEIQVVGTLFLGWLDGKPCRAVELQVPNAPEGSPNAWTSASSVLSAPGENRLALMSLRSLMGRFDEELFKVAGVASQLLAWDRNHRFCGRCGTPTVAEKTERTRSCPDCSLTVYPRISPAIIVAVLKENTILLGHNRRHRAKHVFSVLAGFVEPGESLEECVRREIREEVGIEICRLRYFGSQPWPFPDSLMVAFTAEYRSGEITVDGKEIMDAGWFDRDHLPNIPPHGTIARRLIDWFARTRSKRGASA
jgi:NAD+ diphosphatase